MGVLCKIRTNLLIEETIYMKRLGFLFVQLVVADMEFGETL
jgi:hypothetical protein